MSVRIDSHLSYQKYSITAKYIYLEYCTTVHLDLTLDTHNKSPIMPNNESLCLQTGGKKLIKFLTFKHFCLCLLNLLKPNVNYSVRTAPLTSKVAFYIFI